MSFGLYLAPVSLIGGCDCVSPQSVSWLDVRVAVEDLAKQEAGLRNAGAREGRKGNPSKAAKEIGISRTVTKRATRRLRKAPYCLGTQASPIVGGVSQLLLAYQLRGNYYKMAGDHNAAAAQFSHAEAIYGAVFSRTPKPWKGNYGRSQFVKLIQGLAFWGGKRNTKIPSRPSCGLANNNVLISGGSSIPHLYLGWAELNANKVDIDSIPELTSTKPLTASKLSGILNRAFAPASAKYSAAQSAKGAYYSYLQSAYKSSPNKAEVLAFFKGRLDRRFELAAGRIKLQQAAVLLGAVSKNPKAAQLCLKAAIKLFKQVLNGPLHDNPPELLINALLGLAKANYSLAKVLGSKGRDYAVKAVIINRYLLEGKASLFKNYVLSDGKKDNGGNIFKKDWARAWDLRWSNAVSKAVGDNFQRVMNGKRVMTPAYVTPDTKYSSPITIDILGQAGKNEMDINKDLIEALKLAGNTN